MSAHAGAFRPAAALFAGLLLWLLPSGASALPLVGDEVVVDVSSAGDLAGLGLAVSGSQAPGGDYILEIVGGDIEPGFVGSIETSGLAFRIDNDMTESLQLNDLLWDTTNFLVSGDAAALGTGAEVVLEDVALFEVKSCVAASIVDPCLNDAGNPLADPTLEDWGWDWTDTAVALLNETFFNGSPQLLSGDPFGVARPNLTLVPEPTVAALFTLGLAGLGLAGRRRA